MNITFFLYAAIWMLVGLGLVGVGVTVVRKAHPSAGYVLAGAGAVVLLGTCCGSGVSFANDSYDSTLNLVTSVVGWGRLLLVATLAAASIAMLANKLKAKG